MLLYLVELTIVIVYCIVCLTATFTSCGRAPYIRKQIPPCNALLKSLHLLPVKYRIIFKVLLITFKAIHGLAPVYISELISIRDVSLSRYCLRLTNSLMLNYPALKSRKTLGDRSFFVAAPKLWNELPSDIRDLNSINKFKTAIKTLDKPFYSVKFYAFFISFFVSYISSGRIGP